MLLPSEPVEPITVNKRELASILRCSLPTISAIIERYPDLPIVERGELGREWRLNADDVISFLRAKRAEDERQRVEKNQLLAQLVLPETLTDKDGRLVSIKEAQEAAKLRAMLREEEKEKRFLLQTLEVRIALEKAFRAFSLHLDAAMRQVGRELNLPDPVMRALEAKFANARAAFVRDAGDLLPENKNDDDELVLRG